MKIEAFFNQILESNIKNEFPSSVQQENLKPEDFFYCPSIILNKDRRIFTALHEIGMFDENGRLSGSLRPVESSQLIPLNVSFESTLLNQFLWTGKQINFETQAQGNWKIGELLGEISDIINKKVNICSDNTYSASPSEGEIELASHSSWEILHQEEHLPEIIKSAIYQLEDENPTNQVCLKNLNQLIEGYFSQDFVLHSPIRFFIFCSPGISSLEIKEKIFNSFRREFPFASTCEYLRERKEGSLTEVEVCLADKNVFFTILPAKEYTAISNAEALSLSITNLRKGEVYLRIRHPNPECYILNQLCDRFELIIPDDRRCTLAEVLASRYFIIDLQLEKKMAQNEIQRACQWHANESFIPKALKKEHHLHSIQQFKIFLNKYGFTTQGSNFAFSLCAAIIKQLEKMSCVTFQIKKPDPSLPEFVFNFCRSLQEFEKINDLSIQLIWNYLHHLGWIQNFYSDPLVTSLVKLIIFDQHPFSVLVSWLGIMSLHSTNTHWNGQHLLVRGTQLKVPLNVNEAMDNVFPWVSVCNPAFIDLSRLFEPVHVEKLIPIELSPSEEDRLEKLSLLLLEHSDSNMSLIGVQLALKFYDKRLLPECCLQLSRIVNLNSPILEHLFMRLCQTYAIHVEEKGETFWMDLMLKIYQEKQDLQIEEALYRLWQISYQSESEQDRVRFEDIKDQWLMVQVIAKKALMQGQEQAITLEALVAEVTLFFQHLKSNKTFQAMWLADDQHITFIDNLKKIDSLSNSLGLSINSDYQELVEEFSLKSCRTEITWDMFERECEKYDETNIAVHLTDMDRLFKDFARVENFGEIAQPRLEMGIGMFVLYSFAMHTEINRLKGLEEDPQGDIFRLHERLKMNIASLFNHKALNRKNYLSLFFGVLEEKLPQKEGVQFFKETYLYDFFLHYFKATPSNEMNHLDLLSEFLDLEFKFHLMSIQDFRIEKRGSNSLPSKISFSKPIGLINFFINLLKEASLLKDKKNENFAALYLLLLTYPDSQILEGHPYHSKLEISPDLKKQVIEKFLSFDGEVSLYLAIVIYIRQIRDFLKAKNSLQDEKLLKLFYLLVEKCRHVQLGQIKFGDSSADSKDLPPINTCILEDFSRMFLSHVENTKCREYTLENKKVYGAFIDFLYDFVQKIQVKESSAYMERFFQEIEILRFRFSQFQPILDFENELSSLSTSLINKDFQFDKRLITKNKIEKMKALINRYKEIDTLIIKCLEFACKIYNVITDEKIKRDEEYLFNLIQMREFISELVILASCLDLSFRGIKMAALHAKLKLPFSYTGILKGSIEYFVKNLDRNQWHCFVTISNSIINSGKKQHFEDEFQTLGLMLKELAKKPKMP